MPPKRNTAGNKRTAKAKKTAAGYKFPERIPSGFIVRDTRKEEWCLHGSIGTGGFGEIYSASKANEKSKINSGHPYAVKVEPKENGPLYVEMHFYMRVGKIEDIETWKKSRKLKLLGMPALYGSGTFEYKSNNYRFLVTEKFGRNLQNIFQECGNHFPHVTVLQIGVQVLNVLQYIHEKGFIHGDIKAANLMLGSRPGTENTVYVIDFGLAAKCQVSDKEFNKDPKKAHNGTIEYISRDGHSGVFGFRGDLEILGYNLIHWLTGSLPWIKDALDNQSVVEKKKIELMNNPSSYIKKNLPEVSTEVVKYLEYIASLKNNSVPDYNYCRKLFCDKLSELKCSSPYDKLSFNSNLDEISPDNNKKLVPKAKLNSKKVTAPVIAENTSVTSNVVRSSRKRKSPVLNDNGGEVIIKEDINKGAVRNKNSRKKVVIADLESVPSTSTGVINVNNVDNSDSGSKDNDIEDETRVKRKRVLVRRSSVKLNVKKRLSVVSRTRKPKAKENNQLILNITASDNDADSLQLQNNAKKSRNVPSRQMNKAKDENKPSWRDAPAVKASRVEIAGEYTKTNLKKSSNRKK